ncbi:phosphoribosyltransferase-like predicted ribonucleoside biosynthesis protein [Acinetobacter calcoaceticus]|uniref:Phosphoribosyltransferase-like predicted ribonucleoside biosynthesis protein n=1 Tax=Acinetobacter calcoaceticus TaxID=471 RepID=A0A4R1XTM3_ACICA|nr:phosphoribosyltransferase-like predicted ribonucleoside biosynthesis protein [Acinetobacter calcoaceticus]
MIKTASTSKLEHPPQRKDIVLSRGTISVTVSQQHPDWSLDQLLDFAERINPKRAFLFVSKVLGKHIPVKPSLMQRSYQDLAALIPKDLATPMTVVGMAETAVCLGAGVYRELQKQYPQDSVFLTTTRHPAQGIPKLGDFLEEHSHAQDQFFYSSNDGDIHHNIIHSKTLILVDDEISTGKTFKNLINSLFEANLQHVERIILVSLVNWNDGNLEAEYQGIPIECISLIHGNWQWSPNNQPMQHSMPNVGSTAQGEFASIAPLTWGREPSDLSAQPWTTLLPHLNSKPSATQKVLVLGSGEYAWMPFLMAEQLEQQGIEVYFSSTTRSPIMQGHAIHSICSFQDNYGLGMQNYAYNVKHQAFDQVFLVIETSKHSVDPSLFEQIQHLEIISYDNQTTDFC